MSYEIESLQAVYALLNVTALTADSGIDPSTGSARAVGLYNMVPENVPVPYVRIFVTDTTPIDAEPFDYGTVLKAKTIRLMVDAYSDYHPEMLSVSNVVQSLLHNQEITTTSYHGSIWITSADNLLENVSNPDRILNHAVIRVEVRIETK